MAEGAPPNAIAWRVGRLEQDYLKLDEEKADAKDVAALAEEVRSLRRAVVGFAITIGASAIMFAFGVVAVVG